MQQMNIKNYIDDKTLNRQQRRALEKTKRALIATYPEKLTKVDENDPNMPYTSHASDLREVWRNKQFTVLVWRVPGGTKMSVQRNEWDSHTRRYKDGITWDEIMEIKRAIGFGNMCGVEFFPPDDEVINIANVRHIWFIENDAIDKALGLK